MISHPNSARYTQSCMLLIFGMQTLQFQPNLPHQIPICVTHKYLNIARKNVTDLC